MNKSELKPAVVFEQFAKINEIPRPSKREEKMIEYLKDFGKSRGLETVVDEVGNVIIRKGATPGYEDCKTIILQSHMDMVCDCLPELTIDFDKEGITTYIDGEWMRAKGTTLGADDGIGMAMELAILDSNDIEHGPIECVFTRDEETGLTGAFGMKAGFMTGDFLINLDSEDEGEIFVSCAGGRTTTATLDIRRQNAPNGYFFIKGSVKGLIGGHSGDDINKKRANGLKIIARFVYQEMERYDDVHLVRLHGGSLHNAIPRGGYFVLAVPNAIKENIRADWNVFSAEVDEEFHVTDTQMVWRMRSYDPEPVIDDETARRFVYALQAVDNGVYSICQDEALGGMTETSSNLARVETLADKIEILTSQRSNVMSNLDNMCNTVAAAFKLAGFKVEHSEGYPAWKMRTNSELQKIVRYTYHKLFQKEPVVRGIHAGLECGLFAERYPNLDMVSFGPTLRDVHTPDERLLIPTVQMVWDHLLLTLKSMPHQS
jgi:dipeptidase D